MKQLHIWGMVFIFSLFLLIVVGNFSIYKESWEDFLHYPVELTKYRIPCETNVLQDYTTSTEKDVVFYTTYIQIEGCSYKMILDEEYKLKQLLPIEKDCIPADAWRYLIPK